MMIAKMYVTLMPVIFAGAANMVFTKTSLYKKHSRPIDGCKTFSDGKRIFGDNKTWIGFVGMVFFGAMFQALWGVMCGVYEQLGKMNEIFETSPNTLIFNLSIGTLFGFAYVFFELPNSFIKRRFDIMPGKTAGGIKGAVFLVIDQIDSLLGVVLVLRFVCEMSFTKYWLYILLGALTHIAVNLVLYALKIRKNI